MLTEIVSTNVAVASATVRFRVPGSVMLIVTTVGIGAVVCHGTPTKDVEVSECVYEASVAAPDKIGMSILGVLCTVYPIVSDGDEVVSS